MWKITILIILICERKNYTDGERILAPITMNEEVFRRMFINEVLIEYK